MAVTEHVKSSTGAGQSAEPHYRRHLALRSTVVVATYLALGIIAYWPVLPGISHRLFGRTADYVLSAWFLGWVPHAIDHGLNPFFTNSMFVPTGVNLAQNTESPLLGLLGAPLTEAFSPVVTTNVLMVLAMPLSATAAFVVLRKWKVWLPGAALGGLLYGFSPYMVGQGSDHLVFAFVPIPPFIALTIVSILQRKGSARRLGLQLGLLVVAQYLISQEVLVDVAIFSLVALACVALRHPERIQELVRALVTPSLIALSVIVVLLAYPVWMLVAGPQHSTVGAYPVENPYRNDLLSFFVPGPLQHASFGMRSLGNRLMAGPSPIRFGPFSSGSNPDEFDGYIGVLVLVLAGFLVWRSRRSPRMQLATVMFLAAALLSLGPYLIIDARVTHLPLPFLLLAHIPLVENVLPSRMSLEVFGFLAAIVAFGLDDMDLHRARPSWLTSRLAAGALAAALVVTQIPQWPYSTTPESTLPAHTTDFLTRDPVTITYPFATGLTPQALEWQMENRYAFRLLGGYAHVTNPKGDLVTAPSLMDPPGLQTFLTAQAGVDLYGPPPPLGRELVSATRSALSRYGVEMVIVDRSEPGSGPVMKLFEQTLGAATFSSSQFSLWLIDPTTARG